MALLDRDNFFAVAWGIIYTFMVVLVVALFDAAAVEPTISVPVVVVVLPIVVGRFLVAVERRMGKLADG